MIAVSLHGAEFFAFHGFYPEEQKLGSKFIVDIEVSFDPTTDVAADELHNTIDYEQLYRIASAQMKHTRKLVETVAHAIASQVKQEYGFAGEIRVSIKKINPPLNGKVDHSAIVITMQ